MKFIEKEVCQSNGLARFQNSKFVKDGFYKNNSDRWFIKVKKRNVHCENQWAALGFNARFTEFWINGFQVKFIA